METRAGGKINSCQMSHFTRKNTLLYRVRMFVGSFVSTYVTTVTAKFILPSPVGELHMKERKVLLQENANYNNC